MRQLPEQVHGHSGGGHQVAIDRTHDIHKYVDQAIECLTRAADEGLGCHLRGGNLRQGDDYLDVIIRFAQCAKAELRTTYCPVPTE